MDYNSTHVDMQIDALLEEVKNTPVNMITDDLMIGTVRQYVILWIAACVFLVLYLADHPIYYCS